MVNKKIFEISARLQDVVREQMQIANKSLVALPESETKEKLTVLLRRASSGKVSAQDAQKEINEILKNAGTN